MRGESVGIGRSLFAGATGLAEKPSTCPEKIRKKFIEDPRPGEGRNGSWGKTLAAVFGSPVFITVFVYGGGG